MLQPISRLNSISDKNIFHNINTFAFAGSDTTVGLTVGGHVDTSPSRAGKIPSDSRPVACRAAAWPGPRKGRMTDAFVVVDRVRDGRGTVAQITSMTRWSWHTIKSLLRSRFSTTLDASRCASPCATVTMLEIENLRWNLLIICIGIEYLASLSRGSRFPFKPSVLVELSPGLLDCVLEVLKLTFHLHYSNDTDCKVCCVAALVEIAGAFRARAALPSRTFLAYVPALLRSPTTLSIPLVSRTC